MVQGQSNIQSMNHFIFTPLVLGLLFCCTAPAQTRQKNSNDGASRPLDELITGDALWDTTPDQLEEKFRSMGLQWLDQGKTRARFFGQGMQVFDGALKILEANSDFKDGKLAATSVSLYNRGDSVKDPATIAEFEKQVSEFKDILTARLGVKPVDRGRDAASSVKAIGFLWSKPPTAYLLEYSFQKKMPDKDFRAEFIRLRVAPIPKRIIGSSSNTGNKPVARASLTKNITKDASGDVFINNVPMVDQGPKGYCVVATAERVFRYLGLNVDQHEMAAVADTGSSGGTSPAKMVESLKKLTGRLQIHIRELQSWKYDEFLRMIADYNRVAKKNKKQEIDIAGGRVLDLAAIYSSIDPASLKESKAAPTKGSYTKFVRQVTDTINKGVPVMWCVWLGLFQDGDIPQQGGGHMRLIIGYNQKTNEILYSDSWGARHALKRMRMDDACTMTTGMYYLEPIQ